MDIIEFGEEKALRDECLNSYFSTKFKTEKSQYVPNRHLARYNNALKHLIPFRRKTKQKKILNIDGAGFFSLITFSWMSKYVYRAYKKGLSVDDMPKCSPLDSCDLNAQRLELLWENELAAKGPKNASFGVVVWKFVRTRVFISSLTFSFSCLMGFLSPTICMRKLLEYLEDPNHIQSDGIFWALALTSAEILRTMFFALYFSLSYRTASRLRSACLTMVYKKILRLNSARNTSPGQIINLYSFDGPRLYYMIVFGPMAVGGPILSACGFFYIYFILGPWALLGMIIFISYYPLQYLLSHLSGHYRGKALNHSDKRIKLMTEILTSIKLIKMYAWENWFSREIFEVRKNELKEEEKISYFQSIGISLAPTIPVISGIVTYLIHVVTGGNLSASQAFSVHVFLTKQMKTSIQVIRDGSLSFYEGLISVQRFKAYSILVILLTHLRTSLNNIRWGSENFIQGRLVCNRIKNVLLLEETTTQVSREPNDSLALSVNEGCFMWDVTVVDSSKKDKSTEEEENLMVANEGCEILHSINFSVPKGALIGVCGTVGSGKTSLLLACLGQLKLVSGKVSRSGTCAYVSQQSWLENATLKENILFGENFDPRKYISVLDASVLNDDVNFLPGGDETEVGERGINLSGGQKQRVSLARALYSDRDIYFLDDPLSAVDPQVALKIFEKYILGALRKKTVVLVTSQTQFLQQCDKIIVLKEGRIIEEGTYSELLSNGHDFGSMVKMNSPEKRNEKGSNSVNPEESKVVENGGKSNNEKSSFRKLTQTEEQVRGTVKAKAYFAYVAACGGYIVCFLAVLIILLNVGSNVFSSWWLAMWIKAGGGNTTITDPITNETKISQNIKDNPELSFYTMVYGETIGLIAVTCIIRLFAYTKVTIRASRVLHQNLFDKIMKSPMSYFERTPIGQIQNLISRDVNEVDSRLPEGLETMIQNIWSILFSFLSITLVFPWFLIPLVLLSFLYYFTSKIFRVAVRDLKRIENISRAPVFSSISATIHGLPTIRAFNKEKQYSAQFYKIFDENATAMYLSSNAMRWLAVRLDSISGTTNISRNQRNILTIFITLFTSLLVALLRNDVTPAYAGLALTYAAQICGVLQYTIRLMSENEARFISVERILSAIEKLECEGSLKEEVKAPPNWPTLGAVKFHEVTLSYGADFPEVLKGISFFILGGEKIGFLGGGEMFAHSSKGSRFNPTRVPILGSTASQPFDFTNFISEQNAAKKSGRIIQRVVGRTGAGKSSLVVALFRLVELTSGKILIDGINITKMQLSVLRSRLSVIPQDPTLFSKTLRANLDPFKQHDDSEIWEVLRKTKLAKKVKSMPDLMETYLGEGGNLSVGEKQLLCLARALLRGSKILVLDEATASIDPETEKAIQTTIQEEFKNCTVITIAHRLSTVVNCDRILVIGQGTVLEFDDPQTLMNNPNSHFAKMLTAVEGQ